MVRLRGTSAGRYLRSTCNQPTGTRPDFFSRYLNARPLFTEGPKELENCGVLSALEHIVRSMHSSL